MIVVVMLLDPLNIMVNRIQILIPLGENLIHLHIFWLEIEEIMNNNFNLPLINTNMMVEYYLSEEAQSK